MRIKATTLKVLAKRELKKLAEVTADNPVYVSPAGIATPETGELSSEEKTELESQLQDLEDQKSAANEKLKTDPAAAGHINNLNIKIARAEKLLNKDA